VTIHRETDQLGRQFGKPISVSFRRSKLKSNVLPLDVPQIAKPLTKQTPKLCRIGVANHQRADDRYLRLLREARKRPQDHHAAKQRHELAASWLIELHPVPLPAGAGLQDIELASIGQGVLLHFLAKIFIAGAAKKDDGTLEAAAISVGRAGITPPM
jgi:hypothetical protein